MGIIPADWLATPRAERRKAPDNYAEIDDVSAGYLETMGIRLLQGQWLSEEDMKDSSDAALVSDLVAKRLCPCSFPVTSISRSPRNLGAIQAKPCEPALDVCHGTGTGRGYREHALNLQ